MKKKGSVDRYSFLQSILLISPLLILLIIFYLYPLLDLFPTSLFNGDKFTLEHYQHFFRISLYTDVLVRTIRIALIAVLVCFFVGYPVAYFLADLKGPISAILLLACILLPFWTSVLVRSYTWVVLLQTNGLLNKFLLSTHLIKQPLNLLHNEFAVAVGMVNVLLPFMILPIYSVLKNLDINIIRAAQNLGANIFWAFILVVFPLSLPGVGAGVMFVFILSLGFFITPAILGGPTTLMISTLIDQQINRLMNWEFAATIAALLLLSTIVMIMIFNKLVGLDKLYSE